MIFCNLVTFCTEQHLEGKDLDLVINWRWGESVAKWGVHENRDGLGRWTWLWLPHLTGVAQHPWHDSLCQRDIGIQSRPKMYSSKYCWQQKNMLISTVTESHKAQTSGNLLPNIESSHTVTNKMNANQGVVSGKKVKDLRICLSFLWFTTNCITNFKVPELYLK